MKKVTILAIMCQMALPATTSDSHGLLAMGLNQ